MIRRRGLVGPALAILRILVPAARRKSNASSGKSGSAEALQETYMVGEVTVYSLADLPTVIGDQGPVPFNTLITPYLSRWQNEGVLAP